MFNWYKKEAPVFTGIARGVGGFGFGKRADAVSVPLGSLATGGTIYTYGLYTVHHFPNPDRKNPATYTFTSGPRTVDVAVIAGGGSGGAGYPGAYSGGGGGAGGVRFIQGVSVNGSYPIIVGNGGTEPGGLEYNSDGNGNNGAPSSALGYTAAGGGYGAGNGAVGGPGGSGGGPSHATPSASTGNVPTVSPPQGNPSGSGTPSYSSGGGGGADSAGSSRTGGNAIYLGSYFGNSLGVSGYFAGGGGGGYYSGPQASGGGGGAGASGFSGPGNGDGGDATLNTGSGGGGADGSAPGPRQTYGAGGAGAPGIVIIRYLT